MVSIKPKCTCHLCYLEIYKHIFQLKLSLPAHYFHLFSSFISSNFVMLTWYHHRQWLAAISDPYSSANSSLDILLIWRCSIQIWFCVCGFRVLRMSFWVQENITDAWCFPSVIVLIFIQWIWIFNTWVLLCDKCSAIQVVKFYDLGIYVFFKNSCDLQLILWFIQESISVSWSVRKY